MNKLLIDLYRVLKKLVFYPKALREVLNFEGDIKDYVIRSYNLDCGLPTIDILHLCPNLNEAITPFSFLEGASTPIDIAVLRALARNYKHCKYLEIGTWRGESVANVSEIAEKCVSISLSVDEMRKAGLSTDFIKVHRFFSNSSPNIKHIGHNSHTFDYSLLEDKFDLIFIDGDHTYEGVKIDTKNAFTLVKDNKSVIVWHDYGLSFERVRWSVLAGILDGCPEDKRQNLYHISNSLCAIYTQADYKSSVLNFPQLPNKSFNVQISAKRFDL